ncbi:recombinase family protein [Jeotgalibacillus proteolyticus]|uniref:Recombinase family protein n=1 Tax=Jeotgalibacillus proteolyticus TaxID=2082395 RepID=A0A2S5GG89_9BACL|nr:recombinase family protein [Jeotgalibacillus proteolyticus]PPA71935.1 hypothetical protein C4B60_00730 [Jeotgalibacillus proteolyticus]
MRCAIYIRVSTKLQEKRFSLSAQRFELTKYAENQNWTITDYYQDVESGGKLKKKDLTRLIDTVEDGKIDVVLVVEQDRLSRLDTMEWEILKGVLRDNEVKIAEPGIITDLTNEDHEMISDFKNIIAKRQRRSLVRAMVRGKKESIRKGKTFGSGPFEYKYNKTTKQFEVDPEWAWVIPLIDDLYLKKRYSLRKIAREITKRAKTPSGKSWNESLVRSRLSSKFYHGTIEKEFADGEIITFDDAHEPLRSKETYVEIQSQRSKRQSSYYFKENHRKDVNILRLTQIRCGDCGLKMVLVQRGNKDKPRYYLQHNLREREHPCRNYKTHFNVRRVESKIKDLLTELLSGKEFLMDYLEMGRSEGNIEDMKTSMKDVQTKINTNKNKLDRLLDLYLDQVISKNEMADRRKKIDTQLEFFEKEYASLKQKYMLLQKEEHNIDYLYEYLEVAHEYSRETTPEQQLMVMGRLFPTATLYQDKLILQLDLNAQLLDIPVIADPPPPRGRPYI